MSDDPVAASGAKREFLYRLVAGLIMVFMMLGLILSGPVCVILLVALVQLSVFREVVSLAYLKSKERRLPWLRTTMWYFTAIALYFLYGESLFIKLSPWTTNSILHALFKHHRFLSFLGYSVGLVLFVLNLRKGHYKFQFGLFGLTHVTLFLVVGQSQFMLSNLMEGLIWFVLPVSIIIFNDVSAYMFGKAFGRTPLIKISPKKTWEGFVGAFFSTIVFSFFISRLLSNIPYLACPPLNIVTYSYWSHQKCVLKALFQAKEYFMPPTFPLLKSLSLRIAPIQLHAIVLAIFGSLIAPFGGFFASGFKRAFKLKDFAESIPGHGGVTDRMDCQFLMSAFSYFYYRSFISSKPIGVEDVINVIYEHLDLKERIELVDRLRQIG